MQITVKLLATFRTGRFARDTWERPEGTTVRQILADLGIREDEIGVILVNSRHAKVDRVLEDGDTCALVPWIGGG
jgi:sulfur carrier protein ThiS